MIRWPAAAALAALGSQARAQYQDLHWEMAQKPCLVAIARCVLSNSYPNFLIIYQT